MQFCRSLFVTLLCVLIGTPTALPQSASLTPTPTFVYLNANTGSFCNGCQVFSYITGTTTPLATYTTSPGKVQNQNPVILDSVGSANIWLGNTSAYRIVIEDQNGVVISTTDGISSIFLQASQVTGQSLTVNGTLSADNFQGAYYAHRYGNFTTTGIAGAITACGSAPCVVNVAPSYPPTENPTGWSNPGTLTPPSPNTYPSNVKNIQDNRSGIFNYVTNPPQAVANAAIWQYNLMNWTNPAPTGDNITELWNVENAETGGHNYDYNGVVNKSNFLQTNNYLRSWTQGQTISQGLQVTHYAPGDTLGTGYFVQCFGEVLSAGDEGCEGLDVQMFATGSVEYGGLVSASGASTVTVAPTIGAGTQGEGRVLVDTSSNLISGNISAVTSSGSGPVVLTATAGIFPVSTAIATLGTAVSPGTGTVTPASFSVGSISNISPGTLVCVGDAGGFEIVTPSAVTSSTFTAVFSRPHIAASIIGVGGVCGYFEALDADTQTASTLPTMIVPIQGTIHQMYPMITSTDSTHASVVINGEGQWETYNGLWTSSNNHIYLAQGAYVTSVVSNGAIGNTLGVGPNSAAFTTGDSVFEALAPNVHFGGNDIAEKAFPSSIASNAKPAMFMDGVWSGGDRFQFVLNSTPSALYAANGGSLTPPNLFTVQGEYHYGLEFLNGIDGAFLFENCPVAGCTHVDVPLDLQDAAGRDVLEFDEANSQWYLTSGGETHTFEFQNTGTFIAPNLEASQASGFGLTVVADATIGGVLDVGGATTVNNTILATGNITSSAKVIAGTGFKSGASVGGTQVVNVRKSDNSGPCTITYVGGLFISTTCP